MIWRGDHFQQSAVDDIGEPSVTTFRGPKRGHIREEFPYVKANKKDYYVSGAALFADPEVQPLMGMAYKTFRKHKYGLAEPY